MVKVGICEDIAPPIKVTEGEECPIWGDDCSPDCPYWADLWEGEVEENG